MASIAELECRNALLLQQIAAHEEAIRRERLQEENTELQRKLAVVPSLGKPASIVINKDDPESANNIGDVLAALQPAVATSNTHGGARIAPELHSESPMIERHITNQGRRV